MGKFSDSPYFILQGFISGIDPYGTTYSSTGHLMCGQNQGIVARGGYGVDLWVKGDERYYRIRGLPISGTPDNNKFEFYLAQNNYRISDLTYDQLEDYADCKVYFKKEGLFHDYVDSISSYENYMNTNKLYLYFGKIYPTQENKFCIMFDNLYYYSYRILPQISKNSNIKEFFYLYFDKIHTEIYGLMKNLWTLQDPEEVKSKYLEYIYNMYDSEMLETTLAKQREAAVGLPWFLKRKGTYASLFIIWKSIVGDTLNHLNLYERWHDWPLPVSTTESDNPYNQTQQIPLGHFVDYLYSSYPYYDTLPPTDGAGYVYYNGLPPEAPNIGNYNHTQETASASWSIAHNLGTENVIVEVTDLGGYIVQPYSISILNDNVINVTFPTATSGLATVIAGIRVVDQITSEREDKGVYTHTQVYETESWKVEHNLGIKYGIVEAQNTLGEIIKPSFVEYVDKNLLMINFDIPVSGVATVITGVQLYDKLYGAYLHTEEDEKTQWRVEHNLDSEVVSVEIIGSDDITLLPDSIQMYDENLVIVIFSKGVSGKAIVVKGGGVKKPLYPTDYNYDGHMLTPHYRSEIDLTNEPLDGTDILSEDTANQLISKWDEMKPVCKYSHYTTLISPVTDFSGNYISLYSGTISGLYTACAQYISTVENMVLHTQRSALDKWVVLHNLSSSSVIVQCFNANRKMVMPKKVTCTNSNTVEIEFASAIAGYAFISPPGEIDEQTTSGLTWIVDHLQHGPGANYQYMLAQIENDNREMMVPLSLRENITSITVSFAVARSGYTLIESGDYLHTQVSTSPIWRVNHNLDAIAVQVQCFDENADMIFPQEIELKDQNRVWIRFAESKTGTVVIKKISAGVDTMDTLTGRASYFKIGTGGGPSWTYRTENDLETPVAQSTVTVIDDSDYYYIEGTILDGTRSGLSSGVAVTEIGVFDNTDTILTYTYCDTIYKHFNSEFKIWLRMEKKY